MLRITLCLAFISVSLVGASKILVKHKFNTNPLDDYENQKDPDLVLHRNAPDGNFKMKTGSCPGNRDVDDVNGYYKHCLFQQIKICEPQLKKRNSCFRNEIGTALDRRNMFDFGKEYWYGFSIYIPENYTPDDLKTLYFQLHANGGGAFSPGGPMMALQSIWGRWALRISGSSQCTEAECNYETFFIEFLAPVLAGKWYDWVYHTKISKDWKNPGFARIFLDGKLLFERGSIMTAYQEDLGPYWKAGVYKHEWGSLKIWENHTLINTKFSAYFSAVVIAEGSDPSNFDLVDTRPLAQKLKLACVPCKKGVLNELYDSARCSNMCEKLAKKKGDSHKRYKKFCNKPDEKCDDVGSCCAPCTNKKSSNPAYNRDRCDKMCIKMEEKGDALKKDFLQFCRHPTFTGVCEDHLAHSCNATTGASCYQADGSTTYHCRCAKETIINKRNPLECIPYVPFGGDEPDEIVLGTYKNLWAKPNPDIRSKEYLEGKPFVQPPRPTIVPSDAEAEYDDEE